MNYRNARIDYLEKWLELLTWDFVSQNLADHLYVEFQCDEYSAACEFKE